ncbi:outer membrane protein assembly factor BamB family protein, partial [Acidihalobacter prosperus]
FGKIYHAESTWYRSGNIPFRQGWGVNKNHGGGVLLDLGVHVIDDGWFLMGCPRPVEVFAAMHCSFAALGKGQKLWSHPMSSYAGLTVGSKAVYVSDSHSDIWALDIGTGASLWKQSALHFRQLTAPVIVGNALVVGDYEGYLHWLALNNGKFIARKHVTDSAIEVAPVVKGHNLYVQAANGVLAKYTVGSSHTAKSKSSATHSTNSNSSGSMF